MKDGHMENDETVSNNNNKTAELDSDLGSMEDTVEYRLMMAYANRRLPKKELNAQTNGHETSPSLMETEIDGKQEKKKKKKKKKGFGRRLQTVFKCIKPQTDDETEPPQPAARNHDAVSDRCFVHELIKEDDDEMGELATHVIGIVDEIELNPSGIESDSPEDAVEMAVALLLRDTGDHLNEKFKEANIGQELFLNYGFFRNVIQTFLERIGFRSRDPNALQPQASPKTQIAMACEVTSRLSAVDALPMKRLLDHGARFLQEDYSAWAQQQGGYEAAFHDEEVD